MKFKAGQLVRLKKYAMGGYNGLTGIVNGTGDSIFVPGGSVLLVVRNETPVLFKDTYCNSVSVIYEEKVVDLFTHSTREHMKDFLEPLQKEENGIDK